MKIRSSDPNMINYSDNDSKTFENKIINLERVKEIDVKELLKNANEGVVDIITENAEVADLMYSTRELKRSVQTYSLFFKSLNKKMRRIAKYIEVNKL